MLITAKDNPKIKFFCKLAKSRKAREENRLFVVEGMINCLDMIKGSLSGKIEVTEFFYTKDAADRLCDDERAAIIEKFDSGKRFEITRAVAEKMSSVGNTQGAFAVARMPDIPLTVQSLDPDGKYLVLDSVQDPGNIGTMIRTCAALGFKGAIVTGNSADLYNPKVVRSAMASMPLLDLFADKDFQKVIDLLSAAGIRTFAAVVSGGRSVTDTDFSGGCAAVIGNEGRGLSAEEAAACTERITIGMKGHIDSLNAAAAGTIILWEMSGRGG